MCLSKKNRHVPKEPIHTVFSIDDFNIIIIMLLQLYRECWFMSTITLSTTHGTFPNITAICSIWSIEIFVCTLNNRVNKLKCLELIDRFSKLNHCGEMSVHRFGLLLVLVFHECEHTWLYGCATAHILISTFFAGLFICMQFASLQLYCKMQCNTSFLTTPCSLPFINT